MYCLKVTDTDSNVKWIVEFTSSEYRAQWLTAQCFAESGGIYRNPFTKHIAGLFTNTTGLAHKNAPLYDTCDLTINLRKSHYATTCIQKASRNV